MTMTGEKGDGDRKKGTKKAAERGRPSGACKGIQPDE